jgi:hypothetical protein
MQSGCITNLHICKGTGRTDCNVTTTSFGYNGGYINLEFARDVILQTQNHTTSQENIAMFMHHNYNTPTLIEAFGKSYCFVNTGHHDAAIQGMTKEVYVENVEWYLRLLQTECHQIIWISTTSPRDNSRVQKINSTFEWGNAVWEMLANQIDLPVAFVDVFNASVSFPHRDNIHMASDWYSALADFLGDLLDSCTGMGLIQPKS